ncbi:hypothetical protein [Streptomyces sp. SPB162]|uniref:gluconokinase n=1 Tax=Streptomyces sp. SPB162 TaxID=2940560 RepID=UPI00240647E7|nr:hypothetical protein [Streptomyces sp. SPB162]MDF9817123.1 gluconokinase [Streptomyces sp. SPB162]
MGNTSQPWPALSGRRARLARWTQRYRSDGPTGRGRRQRSEIPGTGRALDDADREPWLRSLADREPWLRSLAHSVRTTSRAHRGAVISCSALKREYRDRLRAAGPGVWFLYLALDEETAHTRIAHRTGHFVKARLLDSQYAALEPLQADEPGLTVDATAGTDPIISSGQAVLARFEAECRPHGG